MRDISSPPATDSLTAPRRRLLTLLFFLVILLGGYLRVAAVLQTEMQHPLRADALDYFSYAYNLRQLGTYSRSPQTVISDESTLPAPDALRSPGYPLMLSIFTGGRPTLAMLTSILLTQAVLGTLLLFLAHGIYRHFLSETWALAASLLTALSPHLVVIGVYVLSESLFAFLCALSVTVALWHFELPRWQRALFCGLVIGLATLTRPTLQYFLIPYLILLAFHLPPPQRFRQPFWILTGFLLVLSPWWLRNLLTMGLVSDPTLMLNTLVHGSYPDFMYNGLRHTLGIPYRFDPGLGDFGSSIPAFLQELYARFSDAPGTYLRWYLLTKPLALFSWVTEIGYTQLPGSNAGKIFIYPVTQSPYFHNPVFIASRALMYYTHWIWVLLCLVATAFAWTGAVGRRLGNDARFAVRLLSALILYFVILHMAGFPLGRYSIPIRPFIYGLALAVLYHIWQLAKPYLAWSTRLSRSNTTTNPS